MKISQNKKKNQKPVEAQTFRAGLKRIWANTRKEIKILVNDRFALVLLFLLPITLIFTINFAGTAGPRPTDQGNDRLQAPNIGIIDKDNSVGYANYDLSEEFINLFKEYEENEQCRLFLGYNRSELEDLIRIGEINAYVIFPEGFEFNLSTHFFAIYRVVIDSLNQNELQDVENFLDEITEVFSRRYDLPGAIKQDITEVNIPERATRLFQISPIFFPIVIFSMTCLVSSQMVIGDIPKDRMVLTPTSKFEILAGKIIGTMFLNSLMVAVMWGLSLGLGMDIKGDLWSYYFIMWSCSFVGSSTGLFISTISNTSLAAFQLFILVFISQTILILFIDTKIILILFPIYSTSQLMLEVSLQGMNMLESLYIVPYIFILWIELALLILFSYIVYKLKRSLL